MRSDAIPICFSLMENEEAELLEADSTPRPEEDPYMARASPGLHIGRGQPLCGPNFASPVLAP